jgi:hypothetical protein
MSLRTFCLTSLAVAASILPVFAQTTTNFTNNTRTITLPPAGLGSTETAQINVINIASNLPGGTAASCAGTISFLNAAGTPIGTASQFTVTAGQLTSASLPFANAGISGVRGEIRGQIQLSITRGVPCAVTFAFETFDTTTGDTHLYLTRQDTVTSYFPVPFAAGQ